MKKNSRVAIAYFISPHGLGHAARAAAVMAAVHRLAPAVHFHIFTTVPQWFFDDCLTGSFTRQPLNTDVGLVQASPLEENLPATIKALDAFYPLDEQRLGAAAAKIKQLGCRLVACDIAPMGIAAARRAGLPSVLVENFTWDWIYAGYPEYAHRFAAHIDYLQKLFSEATYHIQATPVCAPGDAHLTVAPVSRPPRLSVDHTRRQIGVPGDRKLVVFTLGGMAASAGRLNLDTLPGDIFLVVPGGDDRAERAGFTLRLPLRSGVYHPDLVRAADAVIGKAGYSTIAEVYQADVPFGCVSRAGFREAPVLEAFAGQALRSLIVPAPALGDGSWTRLLPALAALPPTGANRDNGADEIAGFFLAQLDRMYP
jgi:hypothetical protein